MGEDEARTATQEVGAAGSGGGAENEAAAAPAETPTAEQPKPTEAAAPSATPDTVNASAESESDPVTDMRRRIATETRRIEAIQKLCAGKHADIEAKAIEEGWDETKTELHLLRASRPQVQIVISDGLNADAVNESLPRLMPALKAHLGRAGLSCGADVHVQNGRVRVGCQIGRVLGVPVVVHLIGERPGTGTNNLSAYMTFGQSVDGVSMWQTIEHSNTTALCSINRRVGVDPEEAAVRIARLVSLMMRHRCSGVALTPFV